MRNHTTIFVAIIGGLAAVFVGWIFIVFVANGSEIRQLKKEYYEIEQRFRDINVLEQNYENIEERYQNTISHFDSLQSSIPKRGRYTAIFEEISELSTRQNVQILSLSPRMEDSFPSLKTKMKTIRKHIARYPVEFNVRGDFLTICAVLEELLNLSTTINLGSVNFESELEVGGLIEARIVLYTYTYHENL